MMKEIKLQLDDGVFERLRFHCRSCQLLGERTPIDEVVMILVGAVLQGTDCVYIGPKPKGKTDGEEPGS